MRIGRLLGCALILTIFSFIVGCEEQSDEPTISVALFQAPASQALVEMIPKFEESEGVNVEYEVLPYSDLRTKVEQQFVSGSSTYDVIMADCIWIPSFAERGFLGQVDTTARAYDFEDLLSDLSDYLGRYPKGGPRYGLPFMSNTHMMAYRPHVVKPVAQEMGIPLPGQTPDTAWTWQQYQEVAQQITEKGGEEVYGTSLQARAGAWLVYEWYSILFGFVDNQQARATGLPRFDQDAEEAMAYYARLYESAPKAALTWGHEEETSAMCSGQTAMDATSNVELASNLLAPECESESSISFAYPPVGKPGQGSPDMGGYGLMLSSDSQNPELASSFILWATSKDVHKQVVLNGGTPVRYSEIRDPDVLEKYPYLKFYDRLIENSVYRARIPQWPELQDVLSRELTAVMRDKKQPQSASSGVQAWIQNNLESSEMTEPADSTAKR